MDGSDVRTPRRSRRIVAVVLVVLVVAAAGFTLRSTSPSGAGPVGLVQSYADTVARDGADDSILFVLAARTNHPDASTCAETVTTARLVRETAATVTIAVFAPRIAAQSVDRSSGLVIACPTSVDYLAALPVHLNAPLGSREVHDAHGGHALTVLAPLTVPTPAYLPPGFAGAGEVRYDPFDGLKDLPGGMSERAYRRYSTGRLRIDVMAVRPAPDRREDDCLPGSRTGSQLVQVCVSGGRYVNLDPLPDGELERVLRNLH